MSFTLSCDANFRPDFGQLGRSRETDRVSQASASQPRDLHRPTWGRLHSDLAF